MKPPDRLRVSAVRFLNTVPLIWGMVRGPQRGAFDVRFTTPAECADDLAAARADVGIVPCAELERLELDFLPGLGIACEGAVRSILLISKVRPERIRTLATDVSSRSSVMLARILLRHLYGVEPLLEPMAPRLGPMLENCDAALIIGDPALQLDPATLPYHVLDLGEQWLRLSGLPMVFAVWAGPKGVITPEAAQIFRESAEYGLARLDEIARETAAHHGVSEELAHVYLSRHIVFRLGERERQGMRRYLELAAALAFPTPGQERITA